VTGSTGFVADVSISVFHSAFGFDVSRVESFFSPNLFGLPARSLGICPIAEDTSTHNLQASGDRPQSTSD